MFVRSPWQLNSGSWRDETVRKAVGLRCKLSNTVAHLITMIDDFLSRKDGSEPGIKTLWSGLQRLTTFATGIRAYLGGRDLCVMAWFEGTAHRVALGRLAICCCDRC
jgi:hypothetical protein